MTLTASTPNTPVTPSALAQARQDPMALLPVVGALIAAVAVLSVVLLLVRRRFLASRHEGNAHAGLMEQMRQMRLDGRMSEEEFNRVKTRLGARLKGGQPIGPQTPGATPQTPRTSTGHQKKDTGA